MTKSLIYGFIRNKHHFIALFRGRSKLFFGFFYMRSIQSVSCFQWRTWHECVLVKVTKSRINSVKEKIKVQFHTYTCFSFFLLQRIFVISSLFYYQCYYIYFNSHGILVLIPSSIDLLRRLRLKQICLMLSMIDWTYFKTATWRQIRMLTPFGIIHSNNQSIHERVPFLHLFISSAYSD